MSGNDSLQKGQKVHISFDAEYICGTSIPGVQCYVNTPSGQVTVPPEATVEVVEDLRPGDVYRTADGALVIYSPEMNVHPDRGEPIAWYVRETYNNDLRRIIDSLVERPLTLLVRDGQPVTP